MNAAVRAWMPRAVRFIRTKFEGRCYWCGFAIPRGSSIAYYRDEREAAHYQCHLEASP